VNHYPKTNLEYVAVNAYGDSSSSATARAATYAANNANPAVIANPDNSPVYAAVIAAFYSKRPAYFDIDAALTCAAGLIYLNVYTLLTR
jgi:hypothetical protein